MSQITHHSAFCSKFNFLWNFLLIHFSHYHLMLKIKRVWLSLFISSGRTLVSSEFYAVNNKHPCGLSILPICMTSRHVSYRTPYLIWFLPNFSELFGLRNSIIYFVFCNSIIAWHGFYPTSIYCCLCIAFLFWWLTSAISNDNGKMNDDMNWNKSCGKKFLNTTFYPDQKELVHLIPNHLIPITWNRSE